MNIRKRVRGLIAGVLGIHEGALGHGSGLNRHPAWDSLKHVAVIACLEDELAIVFEDAEVVEAVNLEALMRLVEIKISGACSKENS